MPSLTLYFDEVEETEGENEYRAWVRRLLDARVELGQFIAARQGRGEAPEFVQFYKGSFNVNFRYKFSDGGPDALIRFPKPGFITTNLRDEKVADEVQVMEYIREKTTIPVPYIHSWGTTADSPQQLGPFIIMDYVEGELVSSILQAPVENDQQEVILNPSIDDSTLNTIYGQIADFLLQLSKLTFDKIGAISQNDNEWSVSKRALTYNMNELASVAAYPQRHFPTSTFQHAEDYFLSLSEEHLIHLRTQRNIARDPEIARARFVARHRFTQLIPKYCAYDSGPFLLFCDDLRPANMLVDPETLKITALIDFEFTNAMPAQFAYDPPWWLLLSAPETYLERDALEEFRDCYEPRLEQFLRALEETERRVEPDVNQASNKRLSVLMRESWRSDRFWFDYAARKSFELDAIYWAVLHESGTGLEALDEKTREEMEPFVEQKMEQLKLYDEDCTQRYSTNNK